MIANVVSLVLGIVVAAASPSPSAPKQTALIREGRVLYDTHCIQCHGANLQGTPNGPDLHGVGVAKVDFMLRTGRMPAEVPGVEQLSAPHILTAQEIKAIVAFAENNGVGDKPSIPQPKLNNNIAQGRKLFDDDCQPCHGSSAQGAIVGFGWIAPTLYPVERDPVVVAEAVRTGPGIMPHFNKHQISDADLNDLLSYVNTLYHPPDIGGYSLAHEGPTPEGLMAWFFGLGSTCTVMVLVGQTLKSREQPDRDKPR